MIFRFIILGFIAFDVQAACLPEPDFEGVLTIENCFEVKSARPEDNGVVFKGQYEKEKFIPGRQTLRTPRYRRFEPRAKTAYDAMPDVKPMEIFFHTKNKKICKQHPKASKVRMRVFFECCESRMSQPSNCRLPTEYYTEELWPVESQRSK